MFLQIFLFLISISSVSASSTLNIIKTPIQVPTPNPGNDFYDPAIVISKNGTSIAFTYDSTSHEIFCNVLLPNSTQWTASRTIFKDVKERASACIDSDGYGAVCSSTQSNQVIVSRFELFHNEMIFEKPHILDNFGEEAKAPVVCVAGPNKQVLAWKTNSNKYFVGFSPKIGSYQWNILPPITASQGKAEDFCLVGNIFGDSVLIWNNSTTSNNNGQYFSQRVNVDNETLDLPIEIPGAIQSGSVFVYQYEGYAAINDYGTVLFAWTDGESRTKSLIRACALFKKSNQWTNYIDLQPNPPSGSTNYQRTSRCSLNNAAEGVVAWEFRDPGNINNPLNVYTSRIKLPENTISSENPLLIPDSYATPFPFINFYGNIVITYSANGGQNYSVSLLEKTKNTFTSTFSLGNIRPKDGEPAKIRFTSNQIQKGVIIFEDFPAKNTYSSICSLFLNKDGLKSVLKEKETLSFQKGL